MEDVVITQNFFAGDLIPVPFLPVSVKKRFGIGEFYNASLPLADDQLRIGDGVIRLVQ